MGGRLVAAGWLDYENSSFTRPSGRSLMTPLAYRSYSQETCHRCCVQNHQQRFEKQFPAINGKLWSEKSACFSRCEQVTTSFIIFRRATAPSFSSSRWFQHLHDSAVALADCFPWCWRGWQGIGGSPWESLAFFRIRTDHETCVARSFVEVRYGPIIRLIS